MSFRARFKHPSILDSTGAKKVGEVSTTVAEFFALRDGLAYAVFKGWSYIRVEGDSKLVTDSVNSLCSVPWCITVDSGRVTPCFFL
ncbi:hypothetical protein ACE6H2_019352 [Prunus campanulata]